MNIERLLTYLRWVKELFFYDKNLQEERLKVCRGCPYYKNKFCKICKCFIPFKTRLEEVSCPILRWKPKSHNWKFNEKH